MSDATNQRNNPNTSQVILSACSPFFRTVLRRNRHEHPLLYLKGVKYADLVSVLNFMYHGEVNVAQEELNSFLAVAEDLKVKGLTQGNSSKNSPTPSVPPPPRPLAAPRPRSPPLRHNSPAPKRPRPPAPSYDDDIQEVEPVVKTEPLAAMAEAPSQHSYGAAAGQEGALAHMEEGGYDDGYDYGGYEEEGFEGGLPGSEQNKGKPPPPPPLSVVPHSASRDTSWCFSGSP